MQRRSSILLVFILGCATILSSGWGWLQHRRLADVEFTQRKLELLEAENDRLRNLVAAGEKSKKQAANSARRDAIAATASEIRGLKFLEPVNFDILTRSGIKKTLDGKLAEQYSDEEFSNVATSLAAIGVLPPGYPLKEKFVDLLGEQVAAFYDQHAHKLFMFEDASLENGQTRVVLAHELTHALQDQHFRLKNLPLEIKDNDDRAVAASSLVEGDATMVMSDYMLRDLTLAGLRENLMSMLSTSMEQLQKAPRYLREMLVFPYVGGQQFCIALHARGGFNAISAAFANPPSSTSQILHPEKYLSEPREEPIEFNWTDTTVLGEKPIGNNVLGELGTRILFTDWLDAANAEKAAEGWRGDRYLVYANGEALVWKSVWASTGDAQEFMEEARRCAEKRYKIPESAFVRVTNAGDVYEATSPRFIKLVLLPGNEVVFINAATKRWAEALETKYIP
jgi:hypothetical protein